MRFIHFYLIAYFLLVGGAAVALWRSGVLQRISPLTLVVAAATVIGLAALLAATAKKPTGC